MKSPFTRFEVVWQKAVWLMPILIASGTLLMVYFNSATFKGPLFYPVLIVFGLVAPLGGLWGIYQSIRYETSPWKYIAIIILVPLGFIWYYAERYRKRVRDVQHA